MKKMIGGRGNERKWMPLAKRLTWCKSMRGLKEKRKRKEGRYINNPLGGEKRKNENGKKR